MTAYFIKVHDCIFHTMQYSFFIYNTFNWNNYCKAPQNNYFEWDLYKNCIIIITITTRLTCQVFLTRHVFIFGEDVLEDGRFW